MLLLIQNNCDCDGFASWIPWLFGAFILGTIFGWLLNKILSSDNSKEELHKVKAELAACKKGKSNKNTLAGASSFTNSKTTSASEKTSNKSNTDTSKKETSNTAVATSLTAKKEADKKSNSTKSNAGKTTKKDTSKKSTHTVTKDVTAKDDLTKVEGIGPKIQGLLYNDGIWTWKQLAATAVSDIQKILDKAGPRYRVHKPGSWPKQAGMAANGEWDKLKKWQDSHKGGIE